MEAMFKASASASASASLDETNGLIHVTTPFLLFSATPLLGLALVSWHMGLDLESPIVVGVLRTFVQLSVLGAILHPIFHYGVEYYWLVFFYCIFMILLASLETSARSRFYFQGMFSCVLAAFLLNIGLVSLFSFGLIIRPKPLWNPQYVIPIVGMLLGNCISGVALSMNAILTSLVEQSQEIELYLSFGGSPEEASSRLMREAVRVGAMPMLNNMAVIGLISIPGMMTGQILAGSPAMEAARYQMLIFYLIAMCAFGTILSEIWVVKKFAFDETQMLRTDRFIKRKDTLSFLSRIAISYNYWRSFFFHIEGTTTMNTLVVNGETEPLAQKGWTTEYVAPKGTLEVFTMHSGQCQYKHGSNLEIRQVSRSFNTNGVDRILFQDISISLQAGDIAAVRGPSGVGKSQLMRLVAGLSPMNSGEMLLDGVIKSDFSNPAQWRRQVRYVSQYKVDIPGTPRQFIKQVSSFHSWRKQGMPSLDEMMASCCRLIQNWGLEPTFLDSEWKLLSGGETQRVHVAIAIASRPRVLLLDESTSALDLDSKTRVEDSVELAASEYGCSVLWITHDEDQVSRMGRLR
jgi:putative ABC transport system permease protein